MFAYHVVTDTQPSVWLIFVIAHAELYSTAPHNFRDECRKYSRFCWRDRVPKIKISVTLTFLTVLTFMPNIISVCVTLSMLILAILSAGRKQ